MKSSGTLFYKDDYDTLYNVDWSTLSGKIDITTIIKTPFVLGQALNGYVQNKKRFVEGTISVIRQIIQTTDDGYTIVAEGAVQYVDFFQTNFNCEAGPSDEFIYHYDSAVSDEIYMKITDGPHFANPSDSDDEFVIWADLDSDGSPIDSTGGTYEGTTLEWIDVWSNP